MNICGFIFARGGSRGCPGKNIRPLGGCPLIGRAIESALRSNFISEVIVSTDDPRIANVARQYGGRVPFLRPAELASDTAPEWFAWRHALEHFDAHSPAGPLDLFVSTPATAPLRQTQDIDRCIELFLKHRDTTDVVLTETTPRSNPYFTGIQHGEDGLASMLFSSSEAPTRRQDAPEFSEITPVTYVVRPAFIRQHSGLFEGRVRTVFVPPERAIDIDTELDFAFAEFLLARQQRLAA